MSLFYQTIWLLAFLSAYSAFFGKRLLRYLQLFQQEDYSPQRLIRWVARRRLFDRRGSLSAFLGFALALFSFQLSLLAGIFAFFGLFLYEENPLKHGKKPLVATERAKRLFRMALILYTLIAICLAALFAYSPAAGWAAIVLTCHLPPFTLIAANLLLAPLEKARQNRFKKQAQEALKRVAPFVIGITGSYGKSSTKNALGQLLRTVLAPTFWPGAGVNTEMGIARCLIEELRHGHRYAVIEMAAYHKGSIARLCQLTPPQAAVITAVGQTHLERFGSQQAIIEAKSELAQALPPGSLLVLNGDDEYVRQIGRRYQQLNRVWYGFKGCEQPLDCMIDKLMIIDELSHFSLLWQGKEYKVTSALLGKALISNLAACFAVAATLGADPDLIAAMLSQLPPMQHRLHITKKEGVTYLNDGYNSNRVGFATALEVLSMMKARRRILMTPGIIELGQEQHTQNSQMGHLAAGCCDKAIVVGSTNKEALIEGLLQGGLKQEQISCAADRSEAFAFLRNFVREGDAVLIENDLGDLYEMPLHF